MKFTDKHVKQLCEIGRGNAVVAASIRVGGTPEDQYLLAVRGLVEVNESLTQRLLTVLQRPPAPITINGTTYEYVGPSRKEYPAT